jgi:hypothetical protein
VALAADEAQAPPQVRKVDPWAADAVRVTVVGRLLELMVTLPWHPLAAAWPPWIWQEIWDPETWPFPFPAPCTVRFTVTLKVSGPVPEFDPFPFPPEHPAARSTPPRRLKRRAVSRRRLGRGQSWREVMALHLLRPGFAVGFGQCG